MARCQVVVRGAVQGVGFRPYVFGLAAQLGLSGFVQNRTSGVLIEVEGEPATLDCFLVELNRRPPPLARIESVASRPLPPRGEQTFHIEPSVAEPASPLFLPADVATCADCLAELFDPTDRRYRYPFLNCTNCGPRLTIIHALPYDRERTSMAGFAMCPDCAAEHGDPANRRFHAQPTACPVCGPRLALCDSQGRPLACNDALTCTAVALRQGQLVAIKGLGGWHLACDAANELAVAELRRRKGRDEKPFALMVADLRAAERLCEVSPAEQALLLSWQRPIVLLGRRASVAVASGVAPGQNHLGVMLPYTPLHHLLLRELAGMPLVMTSGNRSDEPIAYEDQEAVERLGGIADLFLTHNRPIHLRCDDSVTRCVAGIELPVRRARGHAPLPLRLPLACRQPVLALGGQLKVTFALGKGRQAILSHHLGDLDHLRAYQAYTQAIEHYCRLFAVEPELLVHDLHPDYASTRYAQQQAGILRLAVQHHHAHLASCLADNALDEPAIGVIFDGAGYGTDGTIWGGEFLVGDYREFRRAAHFRCVPMPGGEQAVREPWRMALAHLWDAGEEASWFRSDQDQRALRTAEQMIERRFNSPLTSSVGRLFDAVAALAGIRRQVHYEGQAAAELECRAAEVPPDGRYPFGIANAEAAPMLRIDTRPLIGAVVRDVRRGVSASRIGRRFHVTLVEIIGQVCAELREQTGLNTVALSGGVFVNALLLTEACAALASAGFRVYRHRQVPPNDGGLCLGQLAIAAASLSRPDGEA